MTASAIDPQEIITLIDEMACRKVLAKYGPGLDWRDEKMLLSLVWPDAYIDYGFFKGNGEEWVRAFMPIEQAAGRPFHILACEHVEVKGNRAEADSYGISLTRERLPNGKLAARQYWGRYLDTLEKRGKEWRIIKRVYVVHGVFDVQLPDAVGQGTIEGLYVADNLQVTHPFYRPINLAP